MSSPDHGYSPTQSTTNALKKKVKFAFRKTDEAFDAAATLMTEGPPDRAREIDHWLGNPQLGIVGGSPHAASTRALGEASVLFMEAFERVPQGPAPAPGAGAGGARVAGEILFTVADILIADVLRLVDRFDGLKGYPTCRAYVARATARPSYVKAHADQMTHFAVQTEQGRRRKHRCSSEPTK